MAIKLVDEVPSEIDHWGYTNASGFLETVEVLKESYGTILRIIDSAVNSVDIYVADVPKLIKAMQEAIASIKED